MKKMKKLLSALTALAITASAFAGLAIPANAEGTTMVIDGSTLKITADAAYPNAKLVQATYDVGKLMQVTITDTPLTTGENTPDITLLPGAKLMLWSNIAGAEGALVPLAATVTAPGTPTPVTSAPSTSTPSTSTPSTSTPSTPTPATDTPATPKPGIQAVTTYVDEPFDSYEKATIIQSASNSTGTNPSPVPLGDQLIFTAGNRNGIADGGLGAPIASITEDGVSGKALTVKLNKWANDSRGIQMAYTSGANVPLFAAVAADNVLITEFDLKADKDNSFRIGENGGIKVGTNENGISGSAWAHVMAVYDPTAEKQAIIVTDENGNLKDSQVGALSGTGAGKIYFNSATSITTIIMDNLKVYEAKASNFALATIKVQDDKGAAIKDAAVTLADAPYTSGNDGTAQAYVVKGSYAYEASKAGYEGTQGQKDSKTGTFDINASGTYTITLLEQVYTPEPNTVTLTGGQKAMTAPRTAESFDSAKYAVTVIDQNNVAIEDAEITWDITPADSKVEISNGVVTVKKGFDGGTNHVKEYTVKATAAKNGKSKDATATIKISDYLFYEPGIGGSSYGDVIARKFNTNGTDSGDEAYIATPNAKDGKFTITLPEKIEFTNGTAKLLTFKNALTNKNTFTLRRQIALKSSAAEDNTILEIGYINLDVGNATTATWGSSESSFATKYGSMSALNTWTDVSVLFKTNSLGVTKAVLTFGETETDLGTITATDLASFELSTTLNSSDRYALFKDIVIEDVDVSGIGIDGPASFSTISGKTSSQKYAVDAMVVQDNEVFTWSTTIAGGEFTYAEDDTQHLNPTLTVPGTTTAGGTITVVSSEDAQKTATINVTVAAATAESAVFDGPTTVEATADATETYTITNVKDQYGADITDLVTPVWSLEGTDADSVAAIDQNGVLTVKTAGKVTVVATVLGKKITKDVTIAAYSKVVDSPAAGEVDLAGVVNYGTTEYTVTRNDGTTFTKTATDNKITLTNEDINSATKLEIVPNYKFSFAVETDGYTTAAVKENGYGFTTAATAAAGTGTGIQAKGVELEYGKNAFEVDLPDGRYDMTFYKADTNRTHIKVNGYYTVPEADYTDGDGSDPIKTPGIYTQRDVIVEGGVAKITADNWSKGVPKLAAVEITKKSDLEPRKRHIWIAGDSTVTNYRPTPTKDDWALGTRRTGWGQLFEYYLQDSVIVDDFAHSGDYSVGWYNSTFPSVLQYAQEGDYFFVQFGINDRADKNHCPTTLMAEYLGKMVDECRDKGVIPVLITPEICISQYGSVGEHEKSTGSGNAGWFNTNKTVAKEKDVLLIDLADLSGSLWATLGRTWVHQNYFLWNHTTNAEVDPQHMAYQGAKIVASLVATNIYDQIVSGAQGQDATETFANIPVNVKSAADITYTDATDSQEKVYNRQAVTFSLDKTAAQATFD